MAGECQQTRFQFYTGTSDARGGSARRRRPEPRACIYLQIPNSFQYVEARVTPACRSTPISHSSLWDVTAAEATTPLFDATIDSREQPPTGRLYDRWATQKHIRNWDFYYWNWRRPIRFFHVCLHNVSGDSALSRIGSGLRTSICILSLLELARKVWARSSIMVRRAPGPISRLIRIDFPLSVFLGNRGVPPFRRPEPNELFVLHSRQLGQLSLLHASSIAHFTLTLLLCYESFVTSPLLLKQVTYNLVHF